MYNEEKRAALVSKLFKLSTHGKVRWQTTASDNTFQAELGEFVVHVTEERGFDEYAEEPYQYVYLTILDQDGRTLERFDGSDFSANRSDEMDGIFESARAEALGTDKAIDHIMDIIEDLDDIPEDDIPF